MKKTEFTKLLQRSINRNCFDCEDAMGEIAASMKKGKGIEIRLVPDINTSKVVTGWHIDTKSAN